MGVLGYLFSLRGGQKWQNVSKVGDIFRTINFPGVSEFNRESEKPKLP